MKHLITIAKIHGIDYYIYNQEFLADFNRRGVEEEETEPLLLVHDTKLNTYFFERYYLGNVVTIEINKAAYLQMLKNDKK